MSIGSNLPELLVTITASLSSLSGNDMSGIIVGASIGSAFTQMGLVLGITGLMTYMIASKKNIYQIGSLVIISIIILMLTGYDLVIHWIDGLILISIFCIYLVIVILDRSYIHVSEKTEKKLTTLKHGCYCCLVWLLLPSVLSWSSIVLRTLQ